MGSVRGVRGQGRHGGTRGPLWGLGGEGGQGKGELVAILFSPHPPHSPIPDPKMESMLNW